MNTDKKMSRLALGDGIMKNLKKCLPYMCFKVHKIFLLLCVIKFVTKA